MASRPNILWVVTTQWRAQATGYAGDPNARTPWLDALASEAVDYTQAVTPHPLGPQARAALLTGRLCPDNGVRDYFDPLPPDARTIAHALDDRGYATAFFGKWHLYERDRAAQLVGDAHARIKVPHDRRGGFEMWEGFESGFLINDPWIHGSRLAEPVQFKGYQSDVVCQRAAEWCRDRAAKAVAEGTRPYFAVVSLESPHPPYHDRTPHVGEMKPGDLVLRANVPTGGDIERRARDELAGYYAHIEATDRAIGRLVAEVDLNGTIMVFTSTHGDMHGSQGLFRKAWPYEESIRVPMLVRRGDQPIQPRKDGSAISLADLPHLALAWAEGRPWHCHSDSAQISMPAPTEFPLQCPFAWRGFRTARHKLVVRTGTDGDGPSWLYFDLEKDPYESENLAGKPAHARRIAELQMLL
jgi:arylsulfatase A-like enzyme